MTQYKIGKFYTIWKTQQPFVNGFSSVSCFPHLLISQVLCWSVGQASGMLISPFFLSYDFSVSYLSEILAQDLILPFITIGVDREMHMFRARRLSHIQVLLYLNLWPWTQSTISVFFPLGKQECNPVPIWSSDWSLLWALNYCVSNVQQSVWSLFSLLFPEGSMMTSLSSFYK